MPQRILFVDDDPQILKGIQRQFEDSFDLTTAIGPEEALEIMGEEGPFAVIVSDMRMPGMSGAELLAIVRERSPDTVRIVLTGYADLASTIEVVNEGNIFRFLSKPCNNEVLRTAVEDALAQHRLVTAEKELLEGTLSGSVKVLSEMLSLVNPLAFGRTSQVQRIALAIGTAIELPSLWDLKIASMLFPLGCVTVSETALDCVLKGEPVPPEEEAAYEQHAQLAKNMLVAIPRLETVAEIVAYQDKGFDGSGLPRENISGMDIPIGARILKAASDFEIAYKESNDSTVAFDTLMKSKQVYDPDVIEGLASALRAGLCQATSREVRRLGLQIGMVIATDVRGKGGQLFVAAGQEITATILRRLESLWDKEAISEVMDIEVLGQFDLAEHDAI